VEQRKAKHFLIETNTSMSSKTVTVTFAKWMCKYNASVNSSSAHPPPPPRANPRALAFFLKKGQIPGGEDKQVRQMPRVGTKTEGKCPTPGII